jgi:hypothetical protein
MLVGIARNFDSDSAIFWEATQVQKPPLGGFFRFNSKDLSWTPGWLSESASESTPLHPGIHPLQG